MNNEKPQIKQENIEDRNKEFPSLSENRTEKFDEGAVLGTFVLAGIGAFAAKKFWDWKGDMIRKKAGPIADEAIDKVLNKAKSRFFQTVDESFLSANVVDKNIKPEPIVSNYTNKDKNVFESHISGLGIDTKGTATGKMENINNSAFFGKLQNMDERFGALADEDPAFAAEMSLISAESQEQIMSFVRDLDPDTRGKISLAFLSGNLEGAEEAVSDINEKTRIYEETSLEDLNKDELYDLASKIVEAEEKRESAGEIIPKGHKLSDYLRREISKDLVLREWGEESVIDDISAGFSYAKKSRTNELAGIIRSAVEKYTEENPEESENLGFIKKESNDNSTEEFEDKRKMEKIKEEYRRLLKERYTVQKATLKIMAEFLRVNK